ncbi:MAG: glycosyltransferase family 4 protein [Aigarchaeota archaeon]|nr:glycosyltransferase family 4 protein [Aigarchaeota archaeon]MDW8092194.1 glycosyltransferase family 4 protein [Nitrososphaerota archaeon]
MARRILLVNPTYGGASGSGRHVQLLSRGLKEEGFDVDQVSISNTWYINLPMMRSASFLLGSFVRDFSDYDLVHLHNPKLSPLTLRHERMILTVHGGLMELSHKYGRLGEALIKPLRYMMNRASAITSVMLWEARRNGWIWIPNMIDLDAIEKVPPEADERVLFVGRNDRVKNYPLFKRLVQAIGEPYKAFGVEEVAPWERVISYMKSAKCLFITSLWEGMPTSMLEAWACKCPVIAADIEAFRPFRDAVVTAEPNLTTMLTAYRQLDSVKEAIVKRGLEYVKEFDYRVVTRKYARLYESVLSSAVAEGTST